MKRSLRNRTAAAGLTVLVALAATAALAPWIAPSNPAAQDLAHRLAGPSAAHPFGRDVLGRDVLSRVVYGTRISLTVGLATVLISAAFGLAVGAAAGYRGGWTDQLVMRLVDILLAFPGILLAIAFVAVLGPGLRNVLLGLTLLSWTGYARLARAEVLSWRERDFVHAARSLGSSTARIIAVHLTPQVLPSVLVQATFGMAAAIVAEASLSFLGLGVQPPTPSWGAMLNEGREFLLIAPHLTIFPGLAVMLTVLTLNFLGDELRRILAVREIPL